MAPIFCGATWFGVTFTTMATIIGIVGYAGSGKSTLARHLATKGFTERSFASPLKDAVSSLYGMPRAMLEGDTVQSRQWREDPSNSPVSGTTPRALLQGIGDALKKDVDPRIFLRAVEASLQTERRVVVSDVRFPLEADLLRNHGGVIVRVARGEPPAWEHDVAAILRRGGTPFVQGVHASEYAWLAIEPDAVIANDGAPGELHARAEDVLANINIYV